MNILLIGNGFDLMYDLPTKYENFLHTINFLQRYHSMDMKTVGSVMGNELLQAEDKWIARCYKRYKDGWDKASLPEQDIMNLLDKAAKNMWLSYLSKSFDQDLGWIDFEKEVAFVISTLSEVLESFNSRPFDGLLILRKKTDAYIAQKFNFFHDSYKASGRLFDGADQCKIKDSFLLEYPKGSGTMYLDKKKIITRLYDDLKGLAFLLKEYLRIFVEEPLDVLIQEKLIKPNPMFNKVDYIVSFNYTNVYEKLYEITPDRVMHIHGNLSGEIVLGINPDKNDELRTIDTSFLQFKKYYQRVRYQTDVDYLHFIKEVKAQKSTQDYLCLTVIGHSLDTTDKDILMELFDIPEILTILYHEENKICDYMKNIIAMYGKVGLDRLRTQNGLNFFPLTTDAASAGNN